MRALFLLLLCSLPLFATPPFTYFQMPEGWLFSHPSKWGKGVIVGAIQSKRALFTPSLALALEKVGEEMDEATYIAAVKKVHPRCTIQELGSLTTQGGEGRLLQIDLKNGWGEIRLLQLILLHKGYAIVMSSSCLKKEFSTHASLFLKALRSLKISPSLFDSCDDPLFTEKAKQLSNSPSKEQWEQLSRYVEKEMGAQGSCWQFLALQHLNPWKT